MDVATALLMLAGLVVGLAVGAAAAWATARAGRAGLVAERDLLARRVADLEQADRDDAELALALAPLTSSLARVERQVGAMERERAEQLGRLDAQLTAVAASGEALRQQTAALAGALRSPNVRGAWGEVQLRRVVEHAGMLHRVDFDTQPTGTTPDGSTVRPDAVVRLPGGKNVVVDAKAPLAAFLEAASRGGGDAAEAERRRQAATAEHARAVRAHVDALAAKQYWTAFTPAPELVVCFVPGEAFLAAACEADAALLEHAMAKRVVLATPTTLLALLRTVALTWQQDALTGSARELFDVGKELHARLSTLGGHVGKLGRTLFRAVEDYNAVVGTLERRVLVTARRMNDLDLADADLETPEPLETVPRPLTAPELLEEQPRAS
ncbi:MAG: DNA recombination protein RmuC [Actinomycetota bacterium]